MPLSCAQPPANGTLQPHVRTRHLQRARRLRAAGEPSSSPPRGLVVAPLLNTAAFASTNGKRDAMQSLLDALAAMVLRDLTAPVSPQRLHQAEPAPGQAQEQAVQAQEQAVQVQACQETTDVEGGHGAASVTVSRQLQPGWQVGGQSSWKGA